jgi:hypothetical protein
VFQYSDAFQPLTSQALSIRQEALCTADLSLPQLRIHTDRRESGKRVRLIKEELPRFFVDEKSTRASPSRYSALYPSTAAVLILSERSASSFAGSRDSRRWNRYTSRHKNRTHGWRPPRRERMLSDFIPENSAFNFATVNRGFDQHFNIISERIRNATLRGSTVFHLVNPHR